LRLIRSNHGSSAPKGGLSTGQTVRPCPVPQMVLNTWHQQPMFSSCCLSPHQQLPPPFRRHLPYAPSLPFVERLLRAPIALLSKPDRRTTWITSLSQTSGSLPAWRLAPTFYKSAGALFLGQHRLCWVADVFNHLDMSIESWGLVSACP
jgi:hypothetical protein